MKKMRNILYSITVVFGLMSVCAMPAQADPIPFFGSVTSSTCTECAPDPFGFGNVGAGDLGLILGSVEWDPLTEMLISLTIDIGAATFVANPFDFVDLQIVDGMLVGIFAQLLSIDGTSILEIGGAPENGFTAYTLDSSFAALDWIVNGFFTLPPEDPNTNGVTVPEPGTLGLLGFGLIGLAAARRRRTIKT